MIRVFLERVLLLYDRDNSVLLRETQTYNASLPIVRYVTFSFFVFCYCYILRSRKSDKHKTPCPKSKELAHLDLLPRTMQSFFAPKAVAMHAFSSSRYNFHCRTPFLPSYDAPGEATVATGISCFLLFKAVVHAQPRQAPQVRLDPLPYPRPLRTGAQRNSEGVCLFVWFCL